MAKAWSEVDQSDEFQSLPHLEKLQAQQSYFDEVVAPQVSQDEVDQAKSEFLSQYTYSPKAFRQAAESLSISDALDIPPDKIDTKTGADFWDRVDYSASDTDEEVVNKFTTKYPDGVMHRVEIPRKTTLGKFFQPKSHLVFKYDANDDKEKVKTVEDIGVTFKDLGDLAAPAAKGAVTLGLGAATAGTSIVSQMLAYGGAAATAHLVKEGVEESRDTQLQPGKEVVAEAGMEGAIAAGITGVAGVTAKALSIGSGRGAFQQRPEMSALLRDINKAEAAGMEAESLMVHQQAPGNMILGRFGAQAESTSKAAQEKIMAQRASALDALTLKQSDTALQGQKKVLTIVNRIYNKEINELKNKFSRITPRAGDRSLRSGTDEFVSGSRVRVSLKYNTADEMAAKEAPLFDLSPAQAKGQDIKNLVLGDARQVSREVEIPGISIKGTQITKSRTKTVDEQPDPINVANTPEGQLIGVIDDLGKLSPDVINYEVVKQLRTRTGNLIEVWPWEANVNKGQAKLLYKELTKVIENPTNKAPNFVKAHKEASTAAKARYDFLDAIPVQQLIKTEPSGKVIQQLSRPNALTDVHIRLFSDKSFPGNKLNLIKQGIKSQVLLDEGGAIQAIQKYRKNDPEAWRFLVRKKEEREIYSIANDIDKLNASNIGQIVKQEVKATEVLDSLILKKGTTRNDVLDIAASLGPKGQEHLRTAIYNDIITKAETTIKGVPTIDKKALGEVIKDYKKFGIWDSPILTKNDRTKIQGIKSYLELIFYRGQDPGVSLEAAQAITNLKHPATFLSGVHQLTVNSIMAKFLSSKAGNKLLIGSGREAFKTKPLIGTGIIIKGLLEGTEPGDQSLPVNE